MFITFIIKTLSLRLVMRSRITITSLLRFNKSKSLEFEPEFESEQ